MKTQLVKTLKITEGTHERLSKLGSKGDTFEDVIRQLLDYYEKGRIENKK
jgi:predicted CopG family antitoxin